MGFLDDIREHYGTQKPAPVLGTGAPVLATLDGATAYALEALNRECAQVAMALEGTRNDTLNVAAFNLAQLAAGGQLPPHTVVTELTNAARQAGLTDSEILPTLYSGLRKGEQHPRLPSEAKEESWLNSLPTAPTTSTHNGPPPARPGTVPETTDNAQLPWNRANAAAPPTDAGKQTTTSTTPWETPSPNAGNGSATTGGTETTQVEAEPAQSAEEATSCAVRKHLPLVNWQTLWEDDSEEEWIVEPILPARRLVALYSPPKTGKSLLMLEIAAAVAEGSEVLGTKPDRPRKVLYVDFENDPKEDVRGRLQAMGYTPDRLTNLCYLSFPTMNALDTETGSLELMAAVGEYGCEVVVIDTVSRAIKGDENENDTWLNFYRHTGLKLKQEGVSLIRLDHTGKDVAKGMRGGSAKGGDVDAVWRMAAVGTDETTFTLTCEMNRMPIGEKSITINRLPLPHLHHRVNGGGRWAAVRSKIQQLMDHFDDQHLPLDATVKEAQALVKGTGLGSRPGVISEALKERRNLALIHPQLPMEEGE